MPAIRKIVPERAPIKERPSSDDKVVIEELRQKIGELVGRDPSKVATILTEWLKKPSPKKKAG
jgi:hypothetical protein